MLPQLLTFVRERKLLAPGDRLAVAVSGGADSVALVRALLELRGELGVVLSVAHVNHHLRGEESDSDAAFVRELAQAHQLPLHMRDVELQSFSREHRLSIEAAGRAARYDYFRELIASGAVDKVATAHTFDDQAETVLLRLLRGAGTQGLAGVYASVEVEGGKSIVRPLLNTRRCEIEQYLCDIDQTWREDSSNSELHFTRNRIRHELLPLLQRDFNPNLKQVLVETAEIARAEQEYWDSLSAKTVEDLRTERGLDLRRWTQLPTALQRRVIRRVAADARHQLDFHAAEQVREFLLRADAGTLPIASTHIASVRRHTSGEVTFSIEARAQNTTNATGNYEYEFAIPGEVYVPELNIVFRAHLATLDHPHAGKILRLRNWRAGDRFQPFGRGEDKVKRWLQEIRVPAAERPSWPVAELEGAIVWVRGLPPAASLCRLPGQSDLVIEELTR